MAQPSNQNPGSNNASSPPAHRPSPHIPDHTLLRCIGRGAYGEVWLARSVMGTHRAIKIVWRANFDSPQPFDREFLGLQKYEPISRSHEGLMQVLHVGRNDDAGYFYCVMELADDAQPPAADFDPDRYQPRTLQSDLRSRGPLPVQESLRIALRLAQALACLHEQSLVHRDLKPANIIFVKGAPKLADIGLVCATDSTRTHVGTEGYIPPEGSGTPQADIFSLGKVFYEMSTGKRRDEFPDLPTNLRENPEADALLEFNEVILKACAADPRVRYRTARELETDLTLLELGRSLRAKRARQQRGTRLQIAAAFAVLIILGLFLYTQFSRRGTPSPSTQPINSSHAAAESYIQNARILARRSSSHLEGRLNNPRVIEMLEKAVALNPQSAEAHAELALAYTIRLFVYAHNEKDLQEKAYLAVERALSLDPNLPSAYLARGRLKWTPFHHFPHEDAIDDFTKALELDPNLAEARHYRGLVFIHVGLLELGMRDFSTATDFNPSNNGAHYRIGETHLFGCQYQRALDKFDTIDPDFNPDIRAAHISLALIGLGRKEDALKRLRTYLDAHPDDEGGLVTSVEAIVHALFQRHAEAEEAIARAVSRRGFGHFHHTQYHVACAYALMDKKDSALEWLRKSSAEGFSCYPLFLCDTNLDNLRADPRFTELLAAEKQRFDTLQSKYSHLP